MELGAVSEWLCENRLSLHLGKTQSILFGSKKRLTICSELHVTCDGCYLLTYFWLFSHMFIQLGQQLQPSMKLKFKSVFDVLEEYKSITHLRADYV